MIFFLFKWKSYKNKVTFSGQEPLEDVKLSLKSPSSWFHVLKQVWTWSYSRKFIFLTLFFYSASLMLLNSCEDVELWPKIFCIQRGKNSSIFSSASWLPPPFSSFLPPPPLLLLVSVCMRPPESEPPDLGFMPASVVWVWSSDTAGESRTERVTTPC